MTGRRLEILLGVNILYFICVIIVPLISIIAGYLMMKKPPEKINNTVGYRTRRSKASQEAWDFANRYCGRNTFIFGIIIMIVSVIAGIICLKSDTVMGGMGHMLIIMLIQIILLVIVMAVPTEIQLKKRFE